MSSVLSKPPLAVSGFASEMRVLVEISFKLGQYRAEDNRDMFEQTLLALGMPTAEAGKYWDLIDASSVDLFDANQDLGEQVRGVKNNTHLARRLGIILDGKKELARNFLLYRLLALNFPDLLDVRQVGTVHLGGTKGKRGKNGYPAHQRRVLFDRYPLRRVRTLEGREVDCALSICRVYQGHQPAQFRVQLERAAKPLCESLGDKNGFDFAQLLVDCKMLLPPPRMAGLVGTVLRAGLAGQKITLTGAFCPDYAYEETGNLQIPYRYTFDGVGEGVGLVAQQFVRIVPVISRFLRKLGIVHDIVLGIGDFEADSETVLQCVNLNRAEFVRRCQCSLDSFREQVPDDIIMTLELCDIARGLGRFRPYAQEATRRMLAGDFGFMTEVEEDLSAVLARIPGQYRTFYERWYGRVMSDADVNKIVYGQGGEYAALARMYTEDFGGNVIVLAGDRPEMHQTSCKIIFRLRHLTLTPVFVKKQWCG